MLNELISEFAQWLSEADETQIYNGEKSLGKGLILVNVLLGDKITVNYPSTLRDEWASCFTATCLLLRRVRSLTVAPHVYSQVPYEVFKSYTDYANIQNLFLIAKWSLTSHKLKICGFYAPFNKKRFRCRK